jgi:hypothetical protein
LASSQAVDTALIAKLTGDATLMAAAPGGVYREVAPQGVQEPFIIVQQMTHEDQYLLRRQEAFESFLYLVKAVQQSMTAAAVQTCADRIHVLLQNGTMSPTGYNLTLMQREERIATVEIDEDRDLRYQHRGGLYRVIVEPTA